MQTLWFSLSKGINCLFDSCKLHIDFWLNPSIYLIYLTNLLIETESLKKSFVLENSFLIESLKSN
jgi:hypothetical protein